MHVLFVNFFCMCWMLINHLFAYFIGLDSFDTCSIHEIDIVLSHWCSWCCGWSAATLYKMHEVFVSVFSQLLFSHCALICTSIGNSVALLFTEYNNCHCKSGIVRTLHMNIVIIWTNCSILSLYLPLKHTHTHALAHTPAISDELKFLINFPWTHWIE